MSDSEFKDLQVAVENLMGGSNQIEILANDSRIVPLISELRKAKVRIELSVKSGIAMGNKANGGRDANGNQVDVFTFSRISSVKSSIKSNPAPAPAPAPVRVAVLASAPAPVAKVQAVQVPDVDATLDEEELLEVAPVIPANTNEKPHMKRSQHTYRPPVMIKDIIDVLADEASHVVWFKGATGSGKTVAAHYIANALGRKMFQMNCHYGMSPESFVGERTIVIDEKTGQNCIKYQEGVVVKAMQEGLDADGNEVGKPALLFIDEAGAMPPQIAILLNRLLESDDPRRTMTLEHDSGRVIRSHSGFRIILAANTCGRGANSMADAMYTAQTDALDISLLNRVAAVFRFGYDRKVEQSIVREKTGDDMVTVKILKFRDAIREAIKAGRLSTPFSTRHLVKISDMYRIFRDIPKAIYLSVMEQLLPTEMALYNETIIAHFGKDQDVVRKFTADNVDYM